MPITHHSSSHMNKNMSLNNAIRPSARHDKSPVIFAIKSKTRSGKMTDQDIGHCPQLSLNLHLSCSKLIKNSSTNLDLEKGKKENW